MMSFVGAGEEDFEICADPMDIVQRDHRHRDRLPTSQNI